MLKILTERQFRKLKEEGIVEVNGTKLRRRCQHIPGQEHDWGEHQLHRTAGIDGVMCVSRTCKLCDFQQKERISEAVFEENLGE